MNELRKRSNWNMCPSPYEDSDEQVLRDASMEVCYEK